MRSSYENTYINTCSLPPSFEGRAVILSPLYPQDPEQAWHPVGAEEMNEVGDDSWYGFMNTKVLDYLIKNLMQLFKTLHKKYDRSISTPTLTLDPLFQPVFDDEAVTNI